MQDNIFSNIHIVSKCTCDSEQANSFLNLTLVWTECNFNSILKVALQHNNQSIKLIKTLIVSCAMICMNLCNSLFSGFLCYFSPNNNNKK